MDANVRFKGVFNGQLLLEELDALGRVAKQIKVNPQNLVGRDYACRNFCVVKSGEVMLKVGNALVTGTNAPLSSVKTLKDLVIACNGKELNTLVAESEQSRKKTDETVRVVNKSTGSNNSNTQEKESKQIVSNNASVNTVVKAETKNKETLIAKLTDELEAAFKANRSTEKVALENYIAIRDYTVEKIDTDKCRVAKNIRVVVRKELSNLFDELASNLKDKVAGKSENDLVWAIHDGFTTLLHPITKYIVDTKAKIVSADKIIILCIIQENWSSYKDIQKYTGNTNSSGNYFSDKLVKEVDMIVAFTTKGWMTGEEVCNYVESGMCLNVSPDGTPQSLGDGQDFDLFVISDNGSGSSEFANLYDKIQNKKVAVKVRLNARVGNQRASEIRRGKDDGALGNSCETDEVLVIYKNGVKVLRTLEDSDKKYEIRMTREDETRAVKVNVSTEMDELIHKIKGITTILSMYAIMDKDTVQDSEALIIEEECKKLGLECKVKTMHERSHNDKGYSLKDNYSYSGWTKLCVQTDISLEQLSCRKLETVGERIVANNKGVFSKFKTDSYCRYSITNLMLASDGLYVFINESYHDSTDGYSSSTYNLTPIKIEVYGDDSNKVI